MTASYDDVTQTLNAASGPPTEIVIGERGRPRSLIVDPGEL